MSGTFVVVEGVDGTGKTTLAERIRDSYGATYHHVGPPREDATPLAEHLGYLLEHNDERVVFDRFHLGGFAYGRTFRPNNDRHGLGDWAPRDWEMVEEAMLGKTLLVLCDPGWETVEAEWRQRRGSVRQHAEYEADLELVRRVYDDFTTVFDGACSLRRTRYDYTKEGEWDKLTTMLQASLGWLPTAERSSPTT